MYIEMENAIRNLTQKLTHYVHINTGSSMTIYICIYIYIYPRKIRQTYIGNRNYMLGQ